MKDRGPPSEYNEKVQAKAEKYIDGGWEEQGDVVPSMVGLAVYLKKNRDTIYTWRKKFDAFAEVCGMVTTLQEYHAKNGGLSNQMNAQIVKLILANYGYSDRNATEISGPDGGAIQTESKVEWTIQPVKPINETGDE